MCSGNLCPEVWNPVCGLRRKQCDVWRFLRGTGLWAALHRRSCDGKCGAGGRCGNFTAPPLPRTTVTGRATAPKPTGQSANPLPNIGTDDAGNIHCNSTTGTKVGSYASLPITSPKTSSPIQHMGHHQACLPRPLQLGCNSRISNYYYYYYYS